MLLVGKYCDTHRLSCRAQNDTILPSAPVGGQHGGVGADCALHPLIQTSATSESSTKYCSWVSKEKVWIKVCNVDFRERVGKIVF